MYGYIAAVKNKENGEYAFHSLSFKVSSGLWFKTAVKFTPTDIEAIKNNYSKYKALKTLKEEGVIKQINFC